MEGDQFEIPDGLIEVDGNCVPPPPIDVCPNIDGNQTTIPSGLIKDANGNCVPPPPTDFCPNIEGNQASIPPGMIKDANGNCVPPPNPEVPICVLSIEPDSIREGNSATLSWSGNRIASVSINQGIGSVSVSGSRTIRPDEGTHTYIGTFKATNGDTLTCSDTIVVRDDDDGGGGSSKRKPSVNLASLPRPDELPLSFVYLNEMPYTGLDLGPAGTALYWTMLALWSAGAGYLLLFNVMPFALRRVRSFGADVNASLNGEDMQDEHPASIFASVATASRPAGPTAVADSYSSYDGFRSFAQGASLTIDDIVSGLARETNGGDASVVPAVPVEPAHVAPSAALPEHIAAPAVEAKAPVAAPAPTFELADNIPGFISALLAGDRDASFGAIREVTRSGGDPERFLTHAVCALDDAYRAKVDGSPVHPDVAALTRDCHPAFLEKVVTALTAAVDGTYSMGVTGIKLAVTRALGVVNG